MRLKAANRGTSTETTALQAIRTSNDFYGNYFASANELAKGYTLPVVHGSLVKIPTDIIEARDKLIARRKLNAILHEVALKEAYIHLYTLG